MVVALEHLFNLSVLNFDTGQRVLDLFQALATIRLVLGPCFVFMGPEVLNLLT